MTRQKQKKYRVLAQETGHASPRRAVTARPGGFRGAGRTLALDLHRGYRSACFVIICSFTASIVCAFLDAYYTL